MRKFLLCLCILALLSAAGCGAQPIEYDGPPVFFWPGPVPDFVPDEFVQELRELAEEYARTRELSGFQLHWTPHSFQVDERYGVVLLATNRLGRDIENVSFAFTMQAGDVYILQDFPVNLAEVGIIPDNTIIPLLLALPRVSFEAVRALEEEAVMYVEDFTYERVD